MPFQKGNTLGIKKGQVLNPEGAPTKERYNLKWEIIDGYIKDAIKVAHSIVEGTHPDILGVKKERDRLELILKATGHLLKLAPQRQANADGDNMPAPILAYVSSDNRDTKDNGDAEANPGGTGGNVSQ